MVVRDNPIGEAGVMPPRNTTQSSSAARLPRRDRRDQLLEAARRLVVEVGVDAFTMEGLAARAGVSKALPYRHYENAGAVLTDLYQREMLTLAERVASAPLRGDERARARALVHSYFEAVADRSDVLAALTAPGSWVPARADGARRDGVHFVTRLLTDRFGIEPTAARSRAAILLGAFTGATDAWAYGDSPRHTLEAVLVAHVVTAVTGS